MRISRFMPAVLVVVSIYLSGPPAMAEVQPPAARREFRGAWVSTVSNIDWPSRPGLPSEEQQLELLAILDRAVELNLNAIILQVRPAADANYPSKLEPWSPYLSGAMGKPPEPLYDPLEFAIDEAHRRGLQLHVWFNPYRVKLPGKQKVSPDHSSKSRKAIVRKYGDYLWFDPGEPKAVDHFISVLRDVVKRYDVDGVHIDDYFYPYPVEDKTEDDKNKGGTSKKEEKRKKKSTMIPFPDAASYRRAVRRGEKLKIDDWRRQNVNHLIERMYEVVKREKPWVLVGISPFGIWRPDNPPGIKGLDQYSALYADARLWFQQGWLDYMTPQLYWQVESKEQSYPALLDWWAEQNVMRRHLWPGNFTSKVRRDPASAETRDNWSSDEIIRQIEVTRGQPGATGNIHFSMKALMRNNDGIADKLKNGPYAEPALVPETSWLGEETPAKPEIAASRGDDGVTVEMGLARGKAPWQWLVQIETAEGWKNVVVPGNESSHVVSLDNGAEAKAVSVSAVSRLGKLGRPARAEIKTRE